MLNWTTNPEIEAQTEEVALKLLVLVLYTLKCQVFLVSSCATTATSAIIISMQGDETIWCFQHDVDGALQQTAIHEPRYSNRPVGRLRQQSNQTNQLSAPTSTRGGILTLILVLVLFLCAVASQHTLIALDPGCHNSSQICLRQGLCIAHQSGI